MKKAIPLFLFLCSCVDVPVSGPSNRNVSIPYPQPSCSVSVKETAHFIVRACDFQIAEKYAALAERFYDSIMQDTNLYSFIPARPYEVIVYSSKDEYIASTKSQNWSAGLTYGNAILTWPSEDPQAVMAHETAHLIMNEFMENYSDAFIYIAEGLAVYQERKASSASDYSYRGIIEKKVKPSPISFLEMASYKPLKDEKSDYVSKWYAQCSSVVEYLVKNEGAFKFSLFLRDIKKGYDIDSALKDAYAGSFQNYKDLEKKWLYWL